MLLFDVVRAAFGQRRKLLLGGLTRLSLYPLTRAHAQEALSYSGLSQRVRGEELSVEAFIQLANVISQLKETGSSSNR